MYEYAAVIRRVVDGDTIVLDVDLGLNMWRHNESMRLAECDAPELTVNGRQNPDGIAARDALIQLIPVDTKVTITTQKDRKDPWRRYIARIQCASGDVTDWMIAHGHAVARHYR